MSLQISDQVALTDTLLDTTLAIANRAYYRAMFQALIDELQAHRVSVSPGQSDIRSMLSEHEMTCIESAVYRARLLHVAPNITAQDEERAFRRASAEGSARMWATLLLDGLSANGYSLKRLAVAAHDGSSFDSPLIGNLADEVKRDS